MDFEQRLKQRRERELAKTDFWNFSRFADNFTQQGIKDKLFVTDNEYYTPLTEEEKQDIAEKTARREAMEQLQKDSGDLKKIDKFYRDGFYLQEERAAWDKMSFLEKTDALLTQRGKLNRLSDIEEERYKRIGQSSNTFRGNPLVNGHLIADSVMSTGQQFVDGTVSIGNFIADKVSSIGGSIANGVVGVWDFVSDNPITRIIGRIWNGSLNAYEGVTGIIGSLGKSMNVVYEYWYFFVLGIVAIMILLKKI